MGKLKGNLWVSTEGILGRNQLCYNVSQQGIPEVCRRMNAKTFHPGTRFPVIGWHASEPSVSLVGRPHTGYHSVAIHYTIMVDQGITGDTPILVHKKVGQLQSSSEGFWYWSLWRPNQIFMQFSQFLCCCRRQLHTEFLEVFLIQRNIIFAASIKSDAAFVMFFLLATTLQTHRKFSLPVGT